MTAGQQHPQEHCGHECVCPRYLPVNPFAWCGVTTDCEYDTRTHPAPGVDAEQRELIPSEDLIRELERSLEWYKKRTNMLQCWQSLMRDPERKIVCDILANGFTLTTKEEIEQAHHPGADAALAVLPEWIRPLCFGRHEAACDTRCPWGIRKRCVAVRREQGEARR